MKTTYRVVAYDSAEEFQQALNSLEAGWGLHSWVQGQAKFVIAVYAHYLEVLSPSEMAPAEQK